MTSNQAQESVEVLATFAVRSEPGNERVALREVAAAAADRGLTPDQMERLKTAVAEATMNAIEHGNENRPEVPVDITVLQTAGAIAVTITDRGGDRADNAPREVPDIELKLRGEQRPRGWGLFLVQAMVDGMEVSTHGALHTVRLTMHTDSADSADSPNGSEGSDGSEGEDDAEQL
jgi:anti-sigma regulatory factor (Ser/Thr protein kinase)